jgi:secreted PhoX family phosphatase
MSKDFSTLEDSNRSSNPSIHDVSSPARRTLLRGAAATAFLSPLAGVATLSGCASSTPTPAGGPLLGFKGVPVGNADTVVVPEGYSVQVIAPWGDPVGLSGETRPSSSTPATPPPSRRRSWACTTTASTSSARTARSPACW